MRKSSVGQALRAAEVDATALPGMARILEREEISWLPTAVFACTILGASLMRDGRTTTWRDTDHGD